MTFSVRGNMLFVATHLPNSQRRIIGRALRFGTLVFIITFIVRAFFLESFTVTTGSMAPLLLGVHRKCDCPKCGFPVVVGVPPADVDPNLHWQVNCPNCGQGNLGLEKLPDRPGQWLLVDKIVYEWRSPRRWELVVFRGPSDTPYIKRVVGLPGESVQIKDGDVYINGEIARRPPDVNREMSFLIFDGRFQSPDNWVLEGTASIDKNQLLLKAGPTQRTAAVFKLPPPFANSSITDLIVYNGSRVNRMETVKDFRVVFQIDALQGTPSIWFECASQQTEFGLPLKSLSVDQISFDGAGIVPEQPSSLDGFAIHLGKVPPFRLTGPFQVPFTFGIRNGVAQISDVRLYRDTHYQSVGRHGIKSPYRLGSDEYFVLGDNSSVSDDSRMWPEPGVKRSAIIGRPLR